MFLRAQSLLNLISICYPDFCGVLQDLSKDATLNQIPVLVFSTLGQQKDVDRAKQLGAKGYVNKSFFDFDNLLNMILQLSKK